MSAPTERPETSEIVAQLRAEGDDTTRAELAARYGIHTSDAVGIPMRRLKQLAKPLAPDHALASELWASGLYEARTIATLIDDPALVRADQMNAWCADFDNWAIVDSACFNLFDKSPDAWNMITPWADHGAEFIRRAGFALLWALALHDRDAHDSRFRSHLGLIEQHSTDERPLVGKSQTMALRAIATKRPALRAEVVALAQRLTTSANPAARRVGRPITKAFSNTQ